MNEESAYGVLLHIVSTTDRVMAKIRTLGGVRRVKNISGIYKTSGILV